MTDENKVIASFGLPFAFLRDDERYGSALAPVLNERADNKVFAQPFQWAPVIQSSTQLLFALVRDQFNFADLKVRLVNPTVSARHCTNQSG